MVELNYYNSVTTNRFMWAHSLHYSAFLTTEGKQVRVPYVSQYHAKKQGRPCSARLVFDAEDKLIVSKSWHADIYTKVSTPKDRAERLAYRKQLDVILTLAQFRLPEYKENVDIDAELGQPFNTAWATVRGEHEFLMYKNDPVESVYFINGVLAVAQGVVDVLASTRAYKANAIGHYYKFNLTQEEISAKEAERRTKQQTILDTITPEDFRKSLENRIMRANNMHIGSADKSWGQFRERLPYVYHVEATNLLK
jgi:hypothetical protein